MSDRARRGRGFTLIELVVVITISAVVAVFMVFFLTTPVDSYFAQTRRSDMVDSADRILRSVAGDVRSALPNSIRWTSSGSVRAVELLATVGVARYYGLNDKLTVPPLPPGQEAVEELEIAQPDTDFYTLDQFSSLAGRYLAVNNNGAPGAYGFAGIMTPLPLPPPPPITHLGTGEDQVQLGGAGFTFTTASPTHHVFLVSGPVSYLCDTAAQTLQRYTNYTIAAAQGAVATDAQLMAAGASRSLIARNVSACSISIVPATATFGQLLVLSITLTNSGETLQVFQEVSPLELP